MLANELAVYTRRLSWYPSLLGKDGRMLSWLLYLPRHYVIEKSTTPDEWKGMFDGKALART